MEMGRLEICVTSCLDDPFKETFNRLSLKKRFVSLILSCATQKTDLRLDKLNVCHVAKVLNRVSQPVFRPIQVYLLHISGSPTVIIKYFYHDVSVRV